MSATRSMATILPRTILKANTSTRSPQSSGAHRPRSQPPAGATGARDFLRSLWLMGSATRTKT